MGRVVVMGVVLVMLGAAVAFPGAASAAGTDDGGLDAVDYSVFGGGTDSPAKLFALNGDETLSDEDDEAEDDEADDDDDEEDDDEDDEGDDDDDEKDDDEDDEGDDDDDEKDDDGDDEGGVDENDDTADSDDERIVDEWMDDIVDTVDNVTNTSRSALEQSTTERPTTISTTQSQTPTPTQSPTRSPTPTASQTTTVTESRAPAAFEISNPSANASSIAPGETLRVVVHVENVGDERGTFDGALRVDGESVDSAAVSIDGGESEAVAFEHRFDDPGEYELAVGGVDIGTVTVTEPATEREETTLDATADGPERLVQVVDAEVPADWVRAGARTTLRATVVNTANRSVNRTLSVTIEGEAVGNETVSLQPNERRVVSIEFVAAEGTVSVEGFDLGSIDVAEYENASETVESTTGTGTENDRESFVLVALLGLLLGGAGLLIVTRR